MRRVTKKVIKRYIGLGFSLEYLRAMFGRRIVEIVLKEVEK